MSMTGCSSRTPAGIRTRRSTSGARRKFRVAILRRRRRGDASSKQSVRVHLAGVADSTRRWTSGDITITAPFRAFPHQGSQPGYQFNVIVGGDGYLDGARYPDSLQNNYLFTNFNRGQVFSVDTNDRQDLVLPVHHGLGFRTGSVHQRSRRIRLHDGARRRHDQPSVDLRESPEQTCSTAGRRGGRRWRRSMAARPGRRPAR